jgi:phosphoribosylanthranilate isomerase
MGVKVKICGMTSLEDALFCGSAGADALGFIFYERSQRYISPLKASKIIAKLPSYITPVGVFVNEQRSVINSIISETGIRSIQLSGDERPEDCAGYPVKVVKAFRIRTEEDIENTKKFAISAALLDGASNDEYGGSGTTADFNIALGMKKFHPLFLAGGLHPDNVIEALQHVQPYAIDVNSGVEFAPGKKDHSKVTLLFQRIHNFR